MSTVRANGAGGEAEDGDADTDAGQKLAPKAAAAPLAAVAYVPTQLPLLRLPAGARRALAVKVLMVDSEGSSAR